MTWRRTAPQAAPHVRTVREEWARWPGAKKCPRCGCSPEFPCLVFMPPVPKMESVPPDTGEGQCVPAGVFGFEVCTACQQGEEVGYSVRARGTAHMAQRVLLTLEPKTP